MNKVDFTKLGGDPLTLDNLDFLQKALTEGINGLAAVWRWGSSDNILLTPLIPVTSGTNYIWPNGYAIIGNEIYFIQGVTLPISTTVVLDIAEAFDSIGNETFEDLTVHSTHIVRRAILKEYTGAPTELDLVNFITLKDRLASLGAVINLESDWINIGALGAPSYGTNWGGTLKFRKNKLGYVEISGVATATSTTPSTTIFTLPIYFRPIEIKGFILLGSVTGSHDHKCVIQTNGNVDVEYVTSASNPVIIMNPCTFNPNI